MKIVKFLEFINESKQLLPKELLDNIKKFHKKISSTINKKFDDGYATCTYACYQFINQVILNLHSNEQIKFKVISGEFDESGHWWIEYENIIIDLGNNILDKFIDSGKIELIITETNNKKYFKEDTLNIKQFISLYDKELKNY